MISVIRAATVYLFLLLLFRVTGKRSLGQITTFDFVLLLIVNEATDQALMGSDYSITNAVLVITTMVALDIGLSLWKQHSPRMARLTEGVPIVIVDHGKLLKDRMAKVRVDEDDILAAARELQGLERMDQIRFAVLERDGSISIIPASG